MSNWRRAAGLAVAGLVLLSGCGGDAPLGSAPPRGGSLLRPAQHADSGLTALAAGDYARAEAQAAEALRARPEDPYALLALAMTYERTGRPELARQYYQVILALDPQASVMLGAEAPQPMTDLARAGLARLSPPVPGQPALAREVSPANAAQRFLVLRQLVERGLATEQEYALRRAANLGALLPYSESAPAVALDWPPPTAEQVAQRLRAIGQGLESRSLTPAEHAGERQAILDALLPAQPRMRAAAPGRLDQDGLAGHLTWLQSLRNAGLITPEELARERAAGERAVAAAAPAPAPAVSAAPQPIVPAAPAAAKPAAKAPPAKGGGPGVHLASLRSEKAARDGWAALRRKHPDLLGGLEASFPRVELAGKGVFWRIVAGPLPDGAAAEALCRTLKAKRQYCDPTPARR